MRRSSLARWRSSLGWLAAMVSLGLSEFWAFWGALENFHEGWYLPSFLQNVGLMFGQYLAPALGIQVAALTALAWPRVGALLHVALALGAAWVFRGSSAGALLIATPLLGLALLYWVGRPQPRRLAQLALATLPILTIVGFSIEPAWRVAHRLDDGITAARTVAGNGVRLRWAPAGPGWPSSGVSWAEATRRCEYLTPDGTGLSDTPQGVWRLPSVDEAVRSLVRRGHNAGGTWNAARSHADYRIMPDKETPLWDPHSKVIYWWTATEAGPGRAYRIVYNGQVHPMPKSANWGYLAYRCISDPDAESPAS